MKRAILIYLMIMFLFYLLGSFVSWQLNPRLWSEEGRFVFAIIGTILSGMISAFVYEENK